MVNIQEADKQEDKDNRNSNKDSNKEDMKDKEAKSNTIKYTFINN